MRDDFYSVTVNDPAVASTLGATGGCSTRIVVGGAYRTHVPAVRALRKLIPSLDLATAIHAVGKTPSARPAGIESKGVLHVKLDTPDASFMPASILPLGYADDPKAAIYR